MMYTGKPLAQSGPFVRKEAEQARMIVWGNLLEAQKNLNGEAVGAKSLVPASWELCRRPPEGAIEVLAKSVLSFDLESDGGILFTNGFSVFRRSPSGERTQIHKASLISQVVALGPPAESNRAGASTSSAPLTTANL